MSLEEQIGQDEIEENEATFAHNTNQEESDEMNDELSKTSEEPLEAAPPVDAVIYVDSPILGNIDVLDKLRAGSIVAHIHCEEYAYLSNAQKLRANMVAKTGVANDDNDFSMKNHRKPRVDFMKQMTFFPGIELNKMNEKRLKEFIIDCVEKNEEKYISLNMWKSGVDKRSNGEVWMCPNNNTVRFTIGTMLFRATIQAELNKMTEEDLPKNCSRFFSFKEDVDGMEGNYDHVYMFERTRVDPTKSDSMIQMKIFMKFAQLEDGVLFTLDVNIVDVYFLPDMIMRGVLEAIVAENAVNRDKSVALWPRTDIVNEEDVGVDKNVKEHIEAEATTMELTHMESVENIMQRLNFL